jgi:hypothetical protein
MTVLHLTTNMNYKLPQSTITETHLSLSRSLSSLYGLRDSFLYSSLLSLSLSLSLSLNTIFITESSRLFLSSHQETQKAKTLTDKVPSFLRSKWESTHSITMKTKAREKNHHHHTTTTTTTTTRSSKKSQRAHTHLMIDWSSSVVL